MFLCVPGAVFGFVQVSLHVNTINVLLKIAKDIHINDYSPLFSAAVFNQAQCRSVEARGMFITENNRGGLSETIPFSLRSDLQFVTLSVS